MRCKHEDASLINYIDGDTRVNAYCAECEQGWFGLIREWISYRGKPHKPPKWVTRLVEARANGEKQMKLTCCTIGCSKDADFQIDGENGPEDSTHSCTEHMPEAFGTPTWAKKENARWAVTFIGTRLALKPAAGEEKGNG